MYRTITTTIALLLLLILSSHGQANADIAEPPHAISAKSIAGNQISISFDRQLKNTGIRSWQFHINTPNIHVMEASVQGEKVTLLLTQSIHNESNVLLSIDSEAVAAYWSGSKNEAVSNMKVITPASAIHLKNTLNPNKTGFSVEHIIKYMASANPQNVYGTSIFNHEDIRYLVSLAEKVNPIKYTLNDYIWDGSYILSSTPNYPLSTRNTFSNAIIAAQAVLNQSNSTQRQVDEAVITLMNAQNVFLPMGTFLETDQTDADLKIDGNVIYVPFGMSVETLIDKLTRDVEIHDGADNSVTSGDLTRGMKVVISNSPSVIYHIKIEASVSDIVELQSALADTSVSVIKLKANITSSEDIHINHDIHFSATEAYTIAVRNILNNAGFSKDYNVTLLKNVHDEAELLAALNSAGDIGDIIEVIDPIDEFTGLLERVESGNTSYFRSEDRSRAFVSYGDQLQGALSDAQLTNIYIAQDIYVDATLTFPERLIVLSGPASRKSTIRANSITNTLTGNSETINIVNTSGPHATYKSWGNGDPGELDLDQVITLEFSSALDEGARQRVQLALVAGASNDAGGVSVIDATYLAFDWYDSYIALDVRNNVGNSTIYFPEDIEAQLSDLPYSNVKILDPTPFRANIIPNLDQRVLKVVFNQALANSTLALYHADEIIESLNFTRYEGGIPYTHSIYYTTITWDTTDPLNPKLEIYFSAEDINYGDRINLIFKPGLVRNEDNDSILNVILMPG